MNYVKLFNFDNKEVRILRINGELYFVGKDIAGILGYSDTNQAIRKHVDEEDKLIRQFNGSGQNRDMTVINESGVYSLIFASNLQNSQKLDILKEISFENSLQELIDRGYLIPLGYQTFGLTDKPDGKK